MPSEISTKTRVKGFKNFLQNFGDESQFWILASSKFCDFGLCNTCAPILGPILANSNFANLIIINYYHKVTINHRGGILIFGQILTKWKIWILTKIENLKSLTLAEIQILDLCSIWFCQIWIDLVVSFPTTPKSPNLDKFWSTKSKILNITNFNVGSRLRHARGFVFGPRAWEAQGRPGRPQLLVLRIFFKILVMRANFGDFGDFDIDFKILKKVCKDCSPIFWPILENFDFRIWVKSQSYDKPPWRNFDFLSNFEILAKIENLKSLTLVQIQILDPQP